MRIEELLEYKNPDVDEDWRNWAAGVGAAATMAGVGAGVAYDHAKSQPGSSSQAQVQQIKAPKAKVQPPIAQNKPTSPEQVQKAQDILSDPDAQLLKKYAESNGIKGTELAQFMAQCAHESANFKTTKEFGGSLDFRKYDIKFNPEKAKVLGNLHPGDGARYKGRGYIQLTGRYNYKKAGEALGLPLEKHPELVEKPQVAAKVAVWFWKHRVQPQVDNFSNTAQATKPINPAMKGLQDRHDKFSGIKVAINKPVTLAKTAEKMPPIKGAGKPQTKSVKVATAQKPKRST